MGITKKIRQMTCAHCLKKQYDRKTGTYVYRCVICEARFARAGRREDADF